MDSLDLSICLVTCCFMSLLSWDLGRNTKITYNIHPKKQREKTTLKGIDSSTRNAPCEGASTPGLITRCRFVLSVLPEREVKRAIGSALPPSMDCTAGLMSRTVFTFLGDYDSKLVLRFSLHPSLLTESPLSWIISH
jgi:hypothetical protein